jgi:hypothetical protein
VNTTISGVRISCATTVPIQEAGAPASSCAAALIITSAMVWYASAHASLYSGRQVSTALARIAAIRQAPTAG